MGYALLDQPNANGNWFYPPPRRGKIKGAVLHITAGLQDLVVGDGVDHSDQGLFNYLRTVTRKVSWHGQNDSDSYRWNLPSTYTAFHTAGYNSTTIGWEICKRITDWRDVPAAWRKATLRQCALGLAPELKRLGIPRRKCSKAELDRAIAHDLPPAGVCTHAELDPERRTDPGWVKIDGVLTDTFPWEELWAECAIVLGEGTKPNAGKAPFPLPEGHYFGRPRKDPRCHSGYYNEADRQMLAVWQRAMAKRGSRVNTDGRFTLTTLAVVLYHQKRRGRPTNGLIGRSFWNLTI